jgi:TonB family protein
MKISIVTIVLCAWVSAAAQSQSPSFEKRALTEVQQASASSLDDKLPNRPFASWFNELVGRDAGAVWQLAECGPPLAGAGQDLRACAEANVILPNGNRMLVAISVGTFKKGIVGEPAFFQAVVESGDRLYPVRKLRDLPEMLRSPKLPPRRLPDIQPEIQADLPRLNLRAGAPYSSPATGPTVEIVSLPPAPPASRQSRSVAQAPVEGEVITKVKPFYPTPARSMNAAGKVEVRITISEAGRVIKATAISGHPALRHAAEDAARQWVYKPAMANGVPVQVESVLVFSFVLNEQ